MKGKITKLGIGLVASLAIGCGGIGAGGDAENGDDTASGGAAGGGAAGAGGVNDTDAASESLKSATSVDQLNLSSALNFKLPAALKGSSSSVGLKLNEQEKKRSQEACQMGKTVDEVVGQLGSIANMFCHIEVEKELIQFGKKYRLMVGGNEFARIFVDDAKISEGRLEVGFCNNGTEHQNRELIVITGISDHGASGQSFNTGTYDTDSASFGWKSAMTFDTLAEGSSKLEVSQVYANTSQDEEFKRKVALDLQEEGISEALLASSGTWMGSEFSDRGIARFNGEYGMMIFDAKGSHTYENQSFTYEFTRRAFFDSEGYVASESDHAGFEEGGDIYVAQLDVPDYLKADFEPASAEGWVGEGCTDYEEEITIDPETAEHLACESAGEEEEDTNCWDQDEFEEGAVISDDSSSNVEVDE